MCENRGKPLLGCLRLDVNKFHFFDAPDQKLIERVIFIYIQSSLLRIKWRATFIHLSLLFIDKIVVRSAVILMALLTVH